MSGEVLVLAVAGPGECDGIGDYAWQLTRALHGHRKATLVVRRTGGPRQPGSPASIDTAGAAMEQVTSWAELSSAAWMERGRRAAGVFLQYFPQAYVASDFQALTSWLRARHAAHRPVIVTLHEYWPHASLSPRREVMRWRSRRALKHLVAVSTAMVVSQPYSVAELIESGLVTRGMLHVIPVGSAVPCLVVRGEQPAGASAARPTLGMFGQPFMMDVQAVRAVAKWLAAGIAGPRLWWFSRSESELATWWDRHVACGREHVTFFGGLPAGALSARLQEVTVGLALYSDGASTRRSSLAALIEHRLPIVGLDGRYTDDRIRASGAFALTPQDRPAAVPDAIAEVLTQSSRRADMTAAAGRFFSEQLAWPRIAASYVALETGNA